MMSRLLDRFTHMGPVPFLLLALALRLVVMALLPDQNFPDARAYFSGGKAIWETGIINNHTYMPLYSLISFFLGGGWGLYLFDIALSIGTVWLIRALVLDIYNDRPEAKLAANIAALAWAAWPHALFYAVSGLTETSYTFLLCATFLLWYRRCYFWGSLLAVLALLIRPTGELINPLLLAAFVFIVNRDGWRVFAKQMAIYMGLYLLFLAPWWAHNYAKYDQFVRLNLGFGLVLYSGANPANTSGGGVNADNGRGNDVDYSPFYHLTDNVIALDQAMKEKAIEYITENPQRYVELAGVKFIRFWRLWPYAEQYTGWHIIVSSLFSYGVFLLAAIASLVLFFRSHWRSLSPILLFTGYLTAVHMATIGSIRYRFPLEPFIVVIGALFLAWIVCRLLKSKQGSA